MIYPEDYANGVRKIDFMEHPMYVTEEYARNNFNKVKAIPAADNDIVQKVMVPVAMNARTKNFDVTMTLSVRCHYQQREQPLLDTYVFRGEVVLADIVFPVNDDQD